MSRAGATFAASLLALLAIVVAGCGDDGDSTTTVTASTPSTGEEAATDSEPSQQGGDDSHQVSTLTEGFDPQAIYEESAPGVVTVISVFGGGSTSILGGGGGGQGQGSGFVISDTGEILTNAHVVTDADQPSVTGPINEAREVYVKFSDLNQVEAEIVGVDAFSDIALLKVDPADLDLQPLALGSENDVAIGEPVVAIGSPFSQEQSLSLGVISATDRSIPGLTQFTIEGALQTDASINPGNSGGPLLDAAGEVVGINQQINSTSGGNEGVGFAVPIDLAEYSIEQLRKDGEAEYAYVGVETTDLYPQLAERIGLDIGVGALVVDVVEGGPAAEAGLDAGEERIRFQASPRPIPIDGDLITGVDGEPVTVPGDLSRLIALRPPGTTVTLDVLRDGEQEQVEVTLGERPGQ